MEYRRFLPGEQIQSEPLPTGTLRLFRSDWITTVWTWIFGKEQSPTVDREMTRRAFRSTGKHLPGDCGRKTGDGRFSFQPLTEVDPNQWTPCREVIPAVESLLDVEEDREEEALHRGVQGGGGAIA
jgi:hypothetical protein